MPTGVYVRTEYHKNIAIANPALYGKGQIPWNKGKKGVMPPVWNKGKKTGIKPWLGKKRPEVKEWLHFKRSPETIQKLRLAKLGTHRSEETKLKISKTMMGKNWKPGSFHARKDERNDPAYQFWVREVKKRDKNTCAFKNEECVGSNIVHHILPWRDYPQERYNMKNGITLCKFHHPRKREQEKIMIFPLQQIILNKYSNA